MNKEEIRLLAIAWVTKYGYEREAEAAQAIIDEYSLPYKVIEHSNGTYNIVYTK